MDFTAIFETITAMLGDVDIMAILNTVMGYVTELFGGLIG